MCCDVSENVVVKMEKGMFRQFAHMKRMDDRRLNIQTYMQGKTNGYVGKG